MIYISYSDRLTILRPDITLSDARANDPVGVGEDSWPSMASNSSLESCDDSFVRLDMVYEYTNGKGMETKRE